MEAKMAGCFGDSKPWVDAMFKEITSNYNHTTYNQILNGKWSYGGKWSVFFWGLASDPPTYCSVQAQMEDDQETITHTKDLWNGMLFIGFQEFVQQG